MPAPTPPQELTARLLTPCRETEKLCDSLERSVAEWAGGLDHVAAAQQGEMPAARGRAAPAVERARAAVHRAQSRIAGASPSCKETGSPAPQPPPLKGNRAG